MQNARWIALVGGLSELQRRGGPAGAWAAGGGTLSGLSFWAWARNEMHSAPDGRQSPGVRMACHVCTWLQCGSAATSLAGFHWCSQVGALRMGSTLLFSSKCRSRTTVTGLALRYILSCQSQTVPCAAAATHAATDHPRGHSLATVSTCSPVLHVYGMQPWYGELQPHCPLELAHCQGAYAACRQWRQCRCSDGVWCAPSPGPKHCVNMLSEHHGREKTGGTASGRGLVWNAMAASLMRIPVRLPGGPKQR